MRIATKLRICLAAPICRTMASSTARFCSGEMAGDSHTRRSSALSWTASTMAFSCCRAMSGSVFCSRTTSTKARAYRLAMAAILFSVLSQLAHELTQQRLIGRLVHFDLARCQINRQRGSVGLQFAAGIARDARRELKTYAATLAVDLASRKIKVDEPTDQALLREFVGQLGKDGK